MPASAPWTAARLRPHALYDAELSQPKNVGYVQLNRLQDDCILAPDAAALDITGDLEMVARVSLDDWTPSAEHAIIAKWITATYLMRIETNGAIGYFDNAIYGAGKFSAPLGFVDGSTHWIKVTHNTTTGVVSFYTANDSPIEPISWTPVAVAGGVATAAGTRTATTDPLSIGAYGNGTVPMGGKVYRAIVRNGIGGTTVADFNASLSYCEGYTDICGNPWTIQKPKLYDVSGNGRAPVTFGTGANKPKHLPWMGRECVSLPGIAGNYISTPDTAAIDITGPIEIVVRLKATDWSSGNQALAGKLVTGGSNRSWGIYFNAAGNLEIRGSADGAALTGPTVTLSPALVDNTWNWLRIRWSQTTGATVEQAADRLSEPSSWNSIGSSATNAPVFANTTAPIEIGSLNNGTSDFLNGQISRFILRNGIGGTTAADFDAAQCGQTGYGVWTINRSTSGYKTVVQSPAANSARSIILLATDDYIDVPASAFPQIGGSAAASLVSVARLFNTPVSFGRLLSLEPSAANLSYTAVQSNFAGYVRIHDGTNVAAIAGASIAFTPGQRGLHGSIMDGTTLTERVNGLSTTTSMATVGAIPVTNGRIGASAATTANYQDMEYEALVVLNRALTAAEFVQLVDQYGGGL